MLIGTQRYKYLLIACTSLTVLAAAPGHAQSAPAAAPQAAEEAGLRDIVVTARRREESVQTAPLSISAFDSKSLQEKNLQSIADVTRSVPNVQLDAVASESGAASTQISIRGIGQTDYVLTVEPAVGIYLDGVYVGKSLGSLLDTVDVERVEVLRGPQGTLFGKNTIAGAIQVITKRPTSEPEYSMEVTAGRYDRLDAKGAMSGPIADWLRYRFSAAYQSRDGFLHRILRSGERTGETQGDVNRLSGRLILEADLRSDLLATLALDGTRIRETSPPSFLVRVNPGVGFASLFNASVPGGVCLASNPTREANPFCYTAGYTLPVNSKVTYGTGGNTSNTDTKGAALTLDWKPGGIDIKSITAYRQVKVYVDQDLGGTPYYNSQVQQDINFKQFSQETQFSGELLDKSLSYVVGGYYLHEWGRQLFPVQTSLAQFLSGGDVKNDNFAGFGQLTYKILPGLSVTGGFRYTYERRRFNPGLQKIIGYADLATIKIPGFVNPVTNAFGLPGAPLFPAGWYKRTSKSATPMLSVSYQVDPDVLAYATYSKGFKGGGFTMRFFPAVRPAPGTDPDTIIPYAKPEKATSYEVGLKTQLFDHLLRFNVAGFWTDYTNVQVTYNVDPDGAGPIGKIVPVLANAGTVRIKGVEVEAAAVPARWVRFDGSLGYTDAKYRRFTPQALLNFPRALGYKRPNTPKWTYNIGSTLTAFDDDSGNLSLRIDYNYRSGQFKEFSNDPAVFQKSYALVDGGVTYRSADRAWSATIGGTNLTNKAYIVSAVSSDRAQVVRSRPREWYLTLRHSL